MLSPTSSAHTPLHNHPLHPSQNHLLALPEICQNTKEIQQVQTQIVKTGLIRHPRYPTKILTRYSLPPVSNLEAATDIFNHMHNPDTFTWNTLIRAFSQSNTPEEALLVFYEMTHFSISPDNHTFPFLFKACSKLLASQEGKQVHCWVVKLALVWDVFIVNTLIDFYAKCAQLDDARRLFNLSEGKDLVSWNTMMHGYVEFGDMSSAQEMFDEMPDRDEFSWNTMIDGYSRQGEMEMAHGLFREMPKKDVVSWNSLMGGYARLGDVERARELFSRMPQKNVVSWTTVILACVQCGRFEEGLDFLREMLAQNVKANRVTLLSVLPAVAHLGALALGDWIVSYIEKTNIMLDDSLGSALVDMYASCGAVERALYMFERIPNKGIYTWNSMILGFADNSQSNQAIDLFSQMLNAELRPNDVTFVAILKACSHGGLVEEGFKYFVQMSSVYGITPQINHYGCMVDLLGRAGLLKEAEDFINKMPMEPNVVIWNALLSACRLHSNVDIGQRVAKHLIELDPDNSAPFVLLSNIYASYGRWEDVERMRKMMNNQGVRKTPGCSSIELNGVVHEFLAGD